jgi:uncharacterized protein YraI
MTLMSRLTMNAGLLALSTGLAAAAPATVQNDLNLRSGPGPDYDVIAAMPAGTTVNVMGCEASWCRVAFGGSVGFASRGYLGLGGPVAAAPAYGEGYVSGGYAPAYGYDEDSYAYGSYGPGYTYGYSEGERRFGNARRVGEEGAVRSERRVGEDTAIRRARRVGEEGAVRSERRVGEDTTIRRERRVGEEGAVRSERRVGENTTVRRERSNSRERRAAPAQGLNDTANVRSNANATTGAAPSGGSSENDHGPNFIGPGKAKVDNH